MFGVDDLDYKFAVSIAYLRGVCRALKHVPRVETLKTCLKTLNLDQKRKYGLRKHVRDESWSNREVN